MSYGSSRQSLIARLSHLSRLGGLLLAAAIQCACADEYDGTGSYTYPEGSIMFIEEVYPVLLRDCAFPACHAADERFLQIYGPGRARLTADLPVDGDKSDLEALEALMAVRGFINPDDRANSPILRKPLAEGAGGTAHSGVDAFGRDIYRTTNDPGYRTLARWVIENQ